MSADPTLSLDERKLVKAVREARLSPFHLRLAIGAMREAVGGLAALSADELRFFYDWVMSMARRARTRKARGGSTRKPAASGTRRPTPWSPDDGAP